MRLRITALGAGVLVQTIVLLSLSGCGGLQVAQPTPSGPPAYLHISYDGNSGKVGHHMIAQPRAYCGATWTQQGVLHTSGTLPPGLQFEGSRIVGTPQQPGRWRIVTNFRAPECRGKIYPDQNVTVDFNIEGIAPRRVQ